MNEKKERTTIQDQVEKIQPEIPRMPDGESISLPLGERKGIMSEMGTDDTPILMVEQIEEAKKIAKKTGQRIVRRFDKREFVRQFPHAGSDPRMAFTPNHFKFDVAPMATLTVGELRDLCLKCREHPLAFKKAVQVEGLSDSTVIHILKEEYNLLSRAAK